jgi:integral membrane protein
MNGDLLRYRVMAWIVGVLLIVLVCVGVPLKYAGDTPGIAKWVGFVHGVFAYPLYLVLTVVLAWRVKMSPLRTVLTMLAGTVPLVSFVAERANTRWVSAKLLDAQPAVAVPASDSSA